ncbi:MAG TPA: L,D-transpeptidase family protein [Chitinophagaceae bacterium]|nr:L,D-transpeptidase family protein [Chitinophagaceae bacterium]
MKKENQMFANMKSAVWTGLILWAFLTGCGQARNNVETNPKPVATNADTIAPGDIAGNFSDQALLHFDSTEINKFIEAHPAFKSYYDEYVRFYSGRHYSYAWHNKTGLIEQSNILYNYVMQLRDNGVPDAAPYVDEYNQMMEDQSMGLSPERELMLTGQYLFYSGKVLAGVPESDTRQVQWYIPRKKMDYAALLDSLLKGKVDPGKLLLPQYYKLQEKLKAYYEIEKKGSWVTIKPDKKKYHVGDASPVIKEIRKKLFLAGDISNDNQSDVFDEEMEAGIKEFQRRYGLKEDGVAGPGVLKEMAAPLAARIEQIAVNMERCRWLPNETSKDYLFVNIPQFKLVAMEDDSIVFDCNVVVGTATNKTVIFRGDMKYVVFSPYWNVPQSIINKEILPAMKRNPKYLEKHNMEYNGGKIRQKPGPNNSLGLVKFLFPNSFNIYLHDTPSKSLFKEDKRAFSHGCIRVSEPYELAQYLLRNDPSWTPEKITTAMNSGKEQYVTLKKTVPVYLVYFTAFVDPRGKLNFRDDIYARDQAVKEMLFSKNHNAIK